MGYQLPLHCRDPPVIAWFVGRKGVCGEEGGLGGCVCVGRGGELVGCVY